MHERRFSGEISRLRDPERLKRLEVRRVVDLCLQAGHVRSVLDVGTGSGIFAEVFEKRGLVTAGVDVNPEMVAAAQEYVPRGDFRISPAESLPFKDRAFDLVFLGLVLHETDDALKTLQEAHRVSRLMTAVLEWPFENQEFGPPLEHRLPAETIHRIAEQAGFQPARPTRLANLVLYLFEI